MARDCRISGAAGKAFRRGGGSGFTIKRVQRRRRGMMAGTILVTGGSGFIAGYLIRQLANFT